MRATCHVKFVIMVRVIVITLDRTPQRPVVLVYHMLTTLSICFWHGGNQITTQSTPFKESIPKVHQIMSTFKVIQSNS